MLKTIIPLAIGVSLVAAIALCQAPPQPSLSSSVRLIYAEHAPSGTTTVLEIDPSSPSSRRPFFEYRHAPGYNGTFQLAPNGKQLLYTRAITEDHRELHLFDLSSGRDQLLPVTTDSLPTLEWNRSNSAIAYTHPGVGTGAAGAIAILDLATLQSRDVLTSSTAIFYPLGWNDSGTDIFYYTLLDGHHQIRSVSLTGRDRPLVSLGATDSIRSVIDFSLS